MGEENRRFALTSPACRFTLLCNYFDLQRQTGFTLQKRAARAHFCLRMKIAVSIRTPPVGQIPFRRTSGSWFISLVFHLWDVSRGSERRREPGSRAGRKHAGDCRRCGRAWLINLRICGLTLCFWKLCDIEQTGFHRSFKCAHFPSQLFNSSAACFFSQQYQMLSSFQSSGERG